MDSQIVAAKKFIEKFDNILKEFYSINNKDYYIAIGQLQEDGNIKWSIPLPEMNNENKLQNITIAHPFFALINMTNSTQPVMILKV